MVYARRDYWPSSPHKSQIKCAWRIRRTQSHPQWQSMTTGAVCVANKNINIDGEKNSRKTCSLAEIDDHKPPDEANHTSSMAGRVGGRSNILEVTCYKKRWCVINGAQNSCVADNDHRPSLNCYWSWGINGRQGHQLSRRYRKIVPGASVDSFLTSAVSCHRLDFPIAVWKAIPSAIKYLYLSIVFRYFPKSVSNERRIVWIDDKLWLYSDTKKKKKNIT